MRRRARLTLAWLVLALCVAGAVAVGTRFWHFLAEGHFDVRGGPSTIRAAPDQQIHLWPHDDSVTTTCVVTPVVGDSRELTVPEPGKEGTRTDVWWSGSATVTCSRRAGGQIHDAHPVRWAVTLMAGSVLVLVAAARSVKTITRRGR